MAMDEPDHKWELSQLADRHRAINEKADKAVSEMERHNALLREIIKDYRMADEALQQAGES